MLVLQAPPFTFVDNNKTGNDRFHGFAIDILNDVARMLNFDFEIYEVPDGFFGDKNATTGEWNGIIGELLNGVHTNLHGIFFLFLFILSFLFGDMACPLQFCKPK